MNAPRPTPPPDDYPLRVIAGSGDPEVAEIFVAETNPGHPDSRIEMVDGLDPRYPRRDKWIINVSTQWGCPVKCRFCDAGHRFFGSLPARDILAQVRFIRDRHPEDAVTCRKLKVHFARMGEPCLNDEVLPAIAALPDEIRNERLWICVPTTAAAGRREWFERLLKLKKERFDRRFQLQFSLNTTDPDLRRFLMPVTLEDFDWVASYCQVFHSQGGRKPVLNFALAQGYPVDPEVIARVFDPGCTAVKLTPLNPTATGTGNGLASALKATTPPQVEALVTRLASAGFEVLVSIGDPREDRIGSNCGQSVRRLAGQPGQG